MCAPGYCTDALGKCQPAKVQQGTWIGSYSIQFRKAHKPYMAAETEDGSLGFVASLVTVEESHAQWKLAHTPDGFVRFESIASPGLVLGVYPSGENSVEASLRKFNAKEPKAVRQFALPKPVQSSFQIYDIPGKGFEIYHPVEKVSISVESSEYLCQYWGAFWAFHAVPSCSGEELVELAPQLPPGIAVVAEKAAAGHVVTTLNWTQTAMIVVAVVVFGVAWAVISDWWYKRSAAADDSTT
jgi:hypothetical protein